MYKALIEVIVRHTTRQQNSQLIQIACVWSNWRVAEVEEISGNSLGKIRYHMFER